MSSEQDPQVLILDDGELADVRSIFDDLRVPFSENPNDAHAAGDASISLLVTSGVRAQAFVESGEPLPPHHLFVVIAEEKAQLSAVRCDFVLRRPIEPAVLRLLCQRASYQGPERRSVSRVAVGEPVTLVVDSVRRRAILAQLSIQGCGLELEYPLREKSPVVIEFPNGLTASGGLELTGRVVGVGPARNAAEERYDVSVVFDEPDIRTRVTLQAVMAGRLIDFRPKPSLDDEGRELTHEGGATRAADPLPESAERRREPRRRYHRQILAGADGSCRVLLGRDISNGGMRVERDADISLGDALKLAVYGSGRARPVMLSALVDRDDGAEGWFLRFREVPPTVAADLSRLIASLAPIDLLAPQARDVVVSEILDD